MTLKDTNNVQPFFFPVQEAVKPTIQNDLTILPSTFAPDDDFSHRTAYKAYKPIAVLGKYFGIVPLSGLYEFKKPSQSRPEEGASGDEGYDGLKDGRYRRLFLDKVLPLTALGLQIFSGYNIMKLLIYCASLGMKRGIDFLTIILVNLNILTHSPVCTLILCCKAKRIIAYLKRHDHVEVLLRKKGRKLAIFSYTLLITAGFCLGLKTPCWISMLRLHLIEFKVDIRSWYPPVMLEMSVGCFCMSMLVMTMAECQPEVTYILFQYLLKQGFDLLNQEIRKNHRENRALNAGAPDAMLPEADKIRRYRQLHQHLCDLAASLDSITSPTILMSFLANIITGIVAIFLLIDQFNGRVPNVGITFALTVLTIVPFGMIAAISGSADSTTTAASAIVPSIFASMELDTDEAREEAKLFALKVQSNRIRFTASGFFFINRSILTTVVGAMATYVIIMMQFKSETPPAEEEEVEVAI